ncbi:MAG: hypothetical protein COA97_02515 [Flavobacteriales bacterium]|nr:MAG: hypothetical protein COA97_02515 [Flavobacteriales bacterium]
MKKLQQDAVQDIIRREPIITGLTIHPSILKSQISKKTKDLVEKIAKYSWFCKVEEGEVPENIPQHPDEVYKNKGWKGWIDFMGYERMLYEIEEIERRHGSGEQFLLLTKEVDMTTDFHRALELHFFNKSYPALFEVKDGGETLFHIFGEISSNKVK